MADKTEGTGGPPPSPTNDQIRKSEALYELLVKSNAEAAKQNELLRERADILNLSADALRSETQLQENIATKINFMSAVYLMNIFNVTSKHHFILQSLK